MAADSVPRLIGALLDAESTMRALAAWALGKIDPHAGEAAAPLIAVAAEDPEPTVRRSAVIALGRIGRESHGTMPEVEHALERALDDVDVRVHRVALCALRSSDGVQKSSRPGEAHVTGTAPPTTCGICGRARPFC